jgi:hypothetical protein
MLASFAVVLAAWAAVAPAAAVPARRAETVSVTPHEQYSSSVGVLGCKINTNRVAYWPGAVDCNNICVKLTYEGRSLNVLKIDSSGGAHDISYDAWNYLGFGVSARDDPRQGGGIPMQYEFVDPSQCADLLDAGGRVPLTAANSMNFVASCLGQPDSYVARNYALYNILNPVCRWGVDEQCALDLNVSNQPSCPSGLGNNSPLTGHDVYNIQYGTGQEVIAL